MKPFSVLDAARHVLRAADPHEKTTAAANLFAYWNENKSEPIEKLKSSTQQSLPDYPGRPENPKLVDPRNLKRRRLGSIEGRAALLHAIAHIEFNAINLAADMVARFSMDDRLEDAQRHDFIADWVQVCNDEARHFLLIESRLIELGSHYGELPAHDGLWEAAVSTKDDIAARLVIAPMVLEARGLDVTPKMIENLLKFGDKPSADILTIIYNEEIAHVAAGVQWFKYLCSRENRDDNAYFKALLASHFKGSLKPPFNIEARNLAGLKRSFYEPEYARN